MPVSTGSLLLTFHVSLFSYVIIGPMLQSDDRDQRQPPLTEIRNLLHETKDLHPRNCANVFKRPLLTQANISLLFDRNL